MALVSQSGNVAVNALAARRGAAVPHRGLVRQRDRRSTRPTGCAALARDDDVRSIALYLEGDGDGALLCEALAECAERGVGVAVLKVGESSAGAAAATAHTGARGRRPARVPGTRGGGGRGLGRGRARPAGAGEGAVAVPGRAARVGPRRASPSSPAPAATRRSPPTSARGSGFGCRCWTRAPRRGCATLLPDAATVGNPLDYTALIWGDVERLSDIIVTVGDDPSVDRILSSTTRPPTPGAAAHGPRCARESALGAARCPVPVMVSSTLPELLDEARRPRLHRRGRARGGRPPNRAGLRGRPPGGPRRTPRG